MLRERVSIQTAAPSPRRPGRAAAQQLGNHVSRLRSPPRSVELRSMSNLIISASSLPGRRGSFCSSLGPCTGTIPTGFRRCAAVRRRWSATSRIPSTTRNTVQTFLAYRGGEVCGRIAAILNQGHIAAIQRATRLLRLLRVPRRSGSGQRTVRRRAAMVRRPGHSPAARADQPLAELRAGHC